MKQRRETVNMHEKNKETKGHELELDLTTLGEARVDDPTVLDAEGLSLRGQERGMRWTLDRVSLSKEAIRALCEELRCASSEFRMMCPPELYRLFSEIAPKQGHQVSSRQALDGLKKFDEREAARAQMPSAKSLEKRRRKEEAQLTGKSTSLAMSFANGWRETDEERKARKAKSLEKRFSAAGITLHALPPAESETPVEQPIEEVPTEPAPAEEVAHPEKQCDAPEVQQPEAETLPTCGIPRCTSGEAISETGYIITWSRHDVYARFETLEVLGVCTRCVHDLNAEKVSATYHTKSDAIRLCEEHNQTVLERRARVAEFVMNYAPEATRA